MTSAAAAPAPQAPPDVSIRAEPPSPRRLSRKVVLMGILLVGLIVSAALIFGLSDRPRGGVAEPEPARAVAGPPDTIMAASEQYEAGDLELQPPSDSDIVWDESAANNAAMAPPADPSWVGQQGNSTPASTSVAARAEPSADELARQSPILFADSVSPHAAGARVAGAASTERHAEFALAQRSSEERLESSLLPPRSRYELMAGAVIPAALVTELNSDLPGRIVAQVTSPVYDSVSGDYLLIPQGSRLLGAYDSTTSYGDHRLFIIWNRLIFPNGWSIALRGMEGSDPAGAAGVKDRTDHHFDRLAGAIGLSAIISVVANEAEEDTERESLGRSVGDAAAQEAARTGSRIVERELSVRPTLRVRAGAPVRVLVTRDIELRPYRETVQP
jgi:type IV secretion system protein VirB10